LLPSTFFQKPHSLCSRFDALAERGAQYHAPEILCWYASRSIAIQFILLALFASIFIIFRKRVRYIG
jgi:hypothetical protein